jgi:hypothetical protein
MQSNARATKLNDGRLSDRSSQLQSPKQVTDHQHGDSSPEPLSRIPSRLLWWIVKGWWNSLLWWACFACGVFLWCLAFARADDGDEFETILHFFIYFGRVRFQHYLIFT